MKPVTERRSVARVIRGTERGVRNNGAAFIKQSAVSLSTQRPLDEVCTCQEYRGEIYQVYLPLLGLIRWMPEGYQARHGDRAEGYSRASDDPPPQQRHPAHDKGSEPFVGSRRNDVGEMVLSLLMYSMIPSAQRRLFRHEKQRSLHQQMGKRKPPPTGPR